jgi:hypothetical protein
MRRVLPLFTAISLSMATPLQAETLEMPSSTPATTEAAAGYTVTLPGRGMNMTQVEEKFGPPLEKLPEVGDPPIIRWIYPNYTVYFEYQFVINSVLNAPSAPAPQPTLEAPAEPMAPAEMPAPAEIAPPSEDPVEISPDVEIIPAPVEAVSEAPMPATEEETPAEVEMPEAEMVTPAETPSE